MLNIKNAVKEKFEIVKVQDFGSEFLVKSSFVNLLCIYFYIEKFCLF